MIEVVKQLTLQSILTFKWNPAGGCAEIDVETASCNP